MKVVHVSTFDSTYGAAIAAKRISNAIRDSGMESSMSVQFKSEPDPMIFQLQSIPFRPNWLLKVNGLLRRVQKPAIEGMFSPSIFPTRRSGEISEQADIVNLHWINYDALSIEDIGNITKPIVWTMHDMWPFMGCEHYATPEDEPAKRSPLLPGLDISRIARSRKIKSWKSVINFVGPSNWIANLARKSDVTQNHQVHVIPNPIDTDEWYPTEKRDARAKLNLDPDVPVVGFGAFRAGLDPRKGGDLLDEALNLLHSKGINFQALVFGIRSEDASPTKYRIKYLGNLKEVEAIRLAYCAMSTMVIPSRIDNLPNTGVEAAACGIPSVAFDVGGISDIIEPRANGMLVEAFNVERLAECIQGYIELPEIEMAGVSRNCRNLAIQKFGHKRVGSLYIDLYRQILSEQKRVSNG